MERPQDFEEREMPPAEANAQIAETLGEAGEDPAREERRTGGDDSPGVAGAEDRPDI